MNSSSKISPVTERCTTPPKPQIGATIDWKALLLEIIRAFRRNSTITYNGNDRTIEYEYHGHEKQFKFSTSPAIRKYEPDELAEE